MPQKPDPMAEIRASFFVECEELLESLQDALNGLSDGPDDRETINVAFRAVHSIKGGAGAFGLTGLVSFAHRFETVMDEVRSGRLSIDPDAMKLFFQSADMLADHVRTARDDAPAPDGAEAAIEALEGLLPDGVATEETEDAADFQPLGMSFSLDLGDSGPGLPAIGLPDLAAGADDRSAGAAEWAVAFRPHAGLYASGNEPLLVLRALTELGSSSIRCDTGRVPPLDLLNPEEAHLGWELVLHGDLEEAPIREVFEFVEDVADISVSRMEQDGGSRPADAAGDEPHAALPPGNIDPASGAPAPARPPAADVAAAQAGPLPPERPPAAPPAAAP
ncbi:MAG: Hpt domain-containing protein, partial [Paracoccaceae bacterium]